MAYRTTIVVLIEHGLPVDMKTQWKKVWQSASVTNPAIVVDATTCQPGFDLPRCSWSLLNRFRTGQSPCKAFLYTWGLTQSPNCSCGEPQTMSHIVDSCLQTKFEGGLMILHDTEEDAVNWRNLWELQQSRNNNRRCGKRMVFSVHQNQTKWWRQMTTFKIVTKSVCPTFCIRLATKSAKILSHSSAS